MCDGDHKERMISCDVNTTPVKTERESHSVDAFIQLEGKHKQPNAKITS